MSRQLVNSAEAGAAGPRDSAGMIRNSPESEQPQHLPSQVPSQLAKVATALAGNNQALPPDEAKPNDPERTKVGICKVAPAQGNATSGKDLIEPLPLANPPSAGNAAQANLGPCKIPALQSTDGEANQSLGKSTLEQNNAKGGWVPMSQSTVVLGTDGNTSVLPGGLGEVSHSPRMGTLGLSDGSRSKGSESGKGPVLKKLTRHNILLGQTLGSDLRTARSRSWMKSPSFSPGLPQPPDLLGPK